MTKVTTEFSLNQIFALQELGPYTKYLMYQPNLEASEELAMTIDSLPIKVRERFGWSPQGVADGINFFLEKIEKYEVEQFFVYSRIECDVLSKREVNFIRLKPEVLDPLKPSILLVGGGNFTKVTTMVDSLPVARHFVEGGYQVFLLTYRVNGAAAPKALSDVARAIQYMIRHKDILSVDPDRIALVGFGAGANAICNFGTPEIGYEAFHLPKPFALITQAPIIDTKALLLQNKKDGILVKMFGEENLLDNMLKFCLPDKIGNGFPPTYIFCGRDDTVVTTRDSELLHKLLNEAGVPTLLEIVDHAPNACGDATGTSGEGWVERTMDFLTWLG